MPPTRAAPSSSAPLSPSSSTSDDRDAMEEDGRQGVPQAGLRPDARIWASVRVWVTIVRRVSSDQGSPGASVATSTAWGGWAPGSRGGRPRRSWPRPGNRLGPGVEEQPADRAGLDRGGEVGERETQVRRPPRGRPRHGHPRVGRVVRDLHDLGRRSPAAPRTAARRACASSPARRRRGPVRPAAATSTRHRAAETPAREAGAGEQVGAHWTAEAGRRQLEGEGAADAPARCWPRCGRGPPVPPVGQRGERVARRPADEASTAATRRRAAPPRRPRGRRWCRRRQRPADRPRGPAGWRLRGARGELVEPVGQREAPPVEPVEVELRRGVAGAARSSPRRARGLADRRAQGAGDDGELIERGVGRRHPAPASGPGRARRRARRLPPKRAAGRARASSSAAPRPRPATRSTRGSSDSSHAARAGSATASRLEAGGLGVAEHGDDPVRDVLRLSMDVRYSQRGFPAVAAPAAESGAGLGQVALHERVDDCAMSRSAVASRSATVSAQRSAEPVGRDDREASGAARRRRGRGLSTSTRCRRRRGRARRRWRWPAGRCGRRRRGRFGARRRSGGERPASCSRRSNPAPSSSARSTPLRTPSSSHWRAAPDPTTGRRRTVPPPGRSRSRARRCAAPRPSPRGRARGRGRSRGCRRRGVVGPRG